jgi:hypothetical protein
MLGVPAGDYNEDGAIDAADYVVWRDTQNQSVTAWAGADGTGDGMVTQEDFEVWQRNFGKTIPSFGAGSSLANVPEPNSAILLILSCSELYSLVSCRARRPPSNRRGRNTPRKMTVQTIFCAQCT